MSLVPPKGGGVPTCKEMYDHAILRLRRELSCHKKERDKELGELQASLEAALREKAALAAQVEQSSSWISQLEAEVSGLREQSETMTRELATSRGLLLDARREIATLAATKSEVERDAAAYKEDAAISRAMVRDISLVAEQKLSPELCVSPSTSLLQEVLPGSSSSSSYFAVVMAAVSTPDPRMKGSPSHAPPSVPGVYSRQDWVPRGRRRDYWPRNQGALAKGKVFRGAGRLALKDKADELGQLWGEVGKANREFTELQARVSSHSEAKERAQAATSVLEAQFQAARANDSARAKMIARLSFELSRAKIEVVNIRAEVVMNNNRAKQKMAAHSRSVAVAKAELKKALDHANNSRKYERCRSRRETLEQIHTRGVDLSEEIG
ncbi:uncharacterized protein [Nicotiana sylvestris]|uniref:uncharacterized protein n=1 Tax=Nicotiana sylvestris TaxID=4096 RepID=UPI00388CA0BC